MCTHTHCCHYNTLLLSVCVCVCVCMRMRGIQKDLIVLDDIHRVFAVDALTSSHPLTSSEDSIVLPDQITQQFDVISYSKVTAAAAHSGPIRGRRSERLSVKKNFTNRALFAFCSLSELL